MTFPALLAIDAAFAAFGEPVTLLPDVAPVTVTGIRRQPDRDDDLSGVRIRTPEALVLDLKAADAAVLAKGDVIVVAGSRRVLMTAPMYPDALRLVARIETAPEAE